MRSHRWLKLLIPICFIAYMMGQWIMPFVIGLIVAYAFHYPARKLSETLRISPTGSALLITTFLVSIFALFTIFIIPVIKNALFIIIKKLPKLIDTIPLTANEILRNIVENFGFRSADIDISNSFQKCIEQIIAIFPNNISQFLNTGITVVYLIMFVFMTPIITFYLLKDWAKIEQYGAFLLSKFANNSYIQTIKNINTNLGKYVAGQLCVCAILSGIYGISLFFIGAHEYVACGLFSGFLSFAPFFGPFTGFVLTIAMVIDQYHGWIQYLSTCCLYIIVPFLDSNFITPRIIGDRTGIQPFWILFSICATVSVIGLPGIFISVPLAVVLSTICKDAIKRL